MAHGLIEPILLERQETEIRLGICISGGVLTQYVQLLRRYLFQNRSGGIEFTHVSQRKPKVRHDRDRINTIVARFALIDRKGLLIFGAGALLVRLIEAQESAVVTVNTRHCSTVRAPDPMRVVDHFGEFASRTVAVTSVKPGAGAPSYHEDELVRRPRR